MVTLFKNILSTREKVFEYTQQSTRSAKDIFNQGGHVIIKYKNQRVRLLYDNRRIILEPKDFEGFDLSNQLFDSNPHQDIDGCSKARFLSKFSYSIPYLKTTPVLGKSKAVYKTCLDVGVRCFIKGYLSKIPCFGLKGNEFINYLDIITFIHDFDQAKDIKLTRQSISKLKTRQSILRPVPRTRETVAFSAYIKANIPHFCEDSFLKQR